VSPIHVPRCVLRRNRRSAHRQRRWRPRLAILSCFVLCLLLFISFLCLGVPQDARSWRPEADVPRIPYRPRPALRAPKKIETTAPENAGTRPFACSQLAPPSVNKRPFPLFRLAERCDMVGASRDCAGHRGSIDPPSTAATVSRVETASMYIEYPLRWGLRGASTYDRSPGLGGIIVLSDDRLSPADLHRNPIFDASR